MKSRDIMKSRSYKKRIMKVFSLNFRRRFLKDRDLEKQIKFRARSCSVSELRRWFNEIFNRSDGRFFSHENLTGFFAEMVKRNTCSLFEREKENEILDDEVDDWTNPFPNLFFFFIVKNKKYTLPKHIIEYILSFLSIQTSSAISLVNKNFYVTFYLMIPKVLIRKNTLFQTPLLSLRTTKEVVFSKDSLDRIKSAEINYIIGNLRINGSLETLNLSEIRSFGCFYRLFNKIISKTGGLANVRTLFLPNDSRRFEQTRKYFEPRKEEKKGPCISESSMGCNMSLDNELEYLRLSYPSITNLEFVSHLEILRKFSNSHISRLSIFPTVMILREGNLDDDSFMDVFLDSIDSVNNLRELTLIFTLHEGLSNQNRVRHYEYKICESIMSNLPQIEKLTIMFPFSQHHLDQHTKRILKVLQNHCEYERIQKLEIFGNSIVVFRKQIENDSSIQIISNNKVLYNSDFKKIVNSSDRFHIQINHSKDYCELEVMKQEDLELEINLKLLKNDSATLFVNSLKNKKYSLLNQLFSWSYLGEGVDIIRLNVVIGDVVQNGIVESVKKFVLPENENFCISVVQGGKVGSRGMKIQRFVGERKKKVEDW